MKKFIAHKINGEVCLLDHPWTAVQDEAAKHTRCQITVEDYSTAKEHSDGQRKWWKGILLPALSKSNGDTVDVWETRLKLAVLPDDFQPVTIVVNDKEYTYIPSISGLSMKKMNLLIEGSVAHLRNEKIYGNHFMWVTLPDSELKSA